MTAHGPSVCELVAKSTAPTSASVSASAMRMLRDSIYRNTATSSVSLEPEHVSESPGGLVKRQIAGPRSRASDAVGMCISSKLPRAADVAGSEITYLEPLTQSKLLVSQARNRSTKKGRGLPRIAHSDEGRAKSLLIMLVHLASPQALQ